MITKLLKYVKGYTLPSVIAPLSIALEVLMEVCIPFLMSSIIDVGLAAGATEWSVTYFGWLVISANSAVNFVLKIGGLMVALSLLSLAAGSISGIAASVAGTGFAFNLRQALFYKIQSFSFKNTDHFSTGSLITRLTTDVTSVQQAYMMMLRIMVRSPFMLIMAFIMAYKINDRLSLIFVAVVPVLTMALLFIMKFAFPRFSKLFEKFDKMNSGVQENLIGMRVVKAFVREDHETQKFTTQSKNVRMAQVLAEKLVILNMPIMQLCIYACMIAVSYIGGNFVINGKMTPGLLMSFIAYINQILASIMMIGMIMVMVVLSLASIKRIVAVLDEKLDIEDTDADESLEVADGSIEFDNVDFSYSDNKDKLNLENVNLRINSGETVGIIGGTGSSKTTLVQLIPRLYDVTEGECKVGGKNVKDYKLKTLRDSVAMVLQKNVLFSGTIRENLLWGNENATQEEIEVAAKAACAHDFIMSFPNGYDSDLGQGGCNVSGGQKQRLCIARALLKKPKIMILDDSTSAVDTATDAKIRQSFKENFSDITLLIIAQRIASVKDADKIIVLDDGKINAVGTHEELLQSNTIYQEVYYSQEKGADNE